jgi:hypothetical protein
MGLISKSKQQNNADNRENYGSASKGGGGGALLPIPLPWFEPKVGKLNRINIIPWKNACTKPTTIGPNTLEPGDYEYILVYFEHGGVGPNNVPCLCMKDTFGKPCKVCDIRWEARENGEKKLEEKCKNSKKALYVVQDLNSDDPKQLRLFKASFAYFTKELDSEAIAEGTSKGTKMVPYADNDDGSVVVFRAEEEDFNGHKFNKYKGFRFMPREDDEAVTMDAISKAPALDSFLAKITPEQLEAVLNGEDVEDVSAPAKTSTHAPVKETQTAPETKAEAPKETPKKTDSQKTECPHGFEFGRDCDTAPKKCIKCELYDKCFSEQTRLNAQG